MATPASVELEPIKKKLENVYRANKAKLASIEKRFLDSPPTQELRDELKEQSGVLKGLLKAVAVIEGRMGDQELPFGGPRG